MAFKVQSGKADVHDGADGTVRLYFFWRRIRRCLRPSQGGKSECHRTLRLSQGNKKTGCLTSSEIRARTMKFMVEVKENLKPCLKRAEVVGEFGQGLSKEGK